MNHCLNQPGDAQYKPYVTALPELTSMELDGDEDFVVVACDGLWDFVSEDDVALAVYLQLSNDPGKWRLNIGSHSHGKTRNEKKFI